ncbi:MAG: bifunctional diaminohydroxyphosphoribosylaminopyrimidine deaminase/5-amino-6-(5-phosphoribosylamino)uracil reductase RibD [Candidatus Sedimenticola sp. PURPLELP]
MATADDFHYMTRAIALARRGLYTTHPNPRVGCVLVRDGEVIGEGYHRRAGELHAERNAIADAGGRAEGATAYVTLEPCCHHGRTPPCTEGLIEAGVSRVVMAMQDPNPLVSGQGAQRLSEAGIAVESGVLESQARDLNPGFIRRMESGMPFVRCKLAMSLDGRTAMSSGESKWITGPAARADVQRLRARSDAIVTGIGTVLADDPSMNVRLEALPDAGQPVQPLRVVLDPMLEMPLSAKMLTLPGQTLLACSCEPAEKGEALAGEGADVVQLSGSSDGIDLPQLLRYLAKRQINELLIEAGSTLAGAALWQGVVDELVVYAAPHIMGDGGRGLFHLPELELMQDRVELEITDVRMVGKDMRMTIKPKR